ncbi:MAG TPA: HdeD family acid-resistance protein [Bacteroidetes bacterium]|nr:HdeD family acid-resistance protein [Bacteroidota bacterium]
MGTFKVTNKINQWWWPLVMGIIMIIFSFYLMFMPLPAFVGISIFFASLIFASGIIHIIFSLTNRKIMEDWGWYLAMGIFEILVGLAMIFQPGLAMTTVIIFTGFWLMFRGIMGISLAWEMKKIGIKNWGWSMFWSILTLIFSWIILINPVVGILGVVVLTAIPILFLGILAVMLSFVFKSLFI